MISYKSPATYTNCLTTSKKLNYLLTRVYILLVFYFSMWSLPEVRDGVAPVSTAVNTPEHWNH